jgi:hypothetical protein
MDAREESSCCPARDKAKSLIDALQAEAPEGRVVAGWLQALIYANANDLDAAAQRHLPTQTD